MTTTKSWGENDELFAAQLAIGHRFALQVGARLLETGHAVQVTPMRVRASLAEVDDFRDEEDIVVTGQDGREFVVESKSRNLEFEPDPDLYPYDTAFACRASSWDGKRRKPNAIVLTSQRTGAMLVIPGRTFDRWTRERGRDGVRGIVSQWYMAPKGVLRPMDELLAYLRDRWPRERP